MWNGESSLINLEAGNQNLMRDSSFASRRQLLDQLEGSQPLGAGGSFGCPQLILNLTSTPIALFFDERTRPLRHDWFALRA